MLCMIQWIKKITVYFSVCAAARNDFVCNGVSVLVKMVSFELFFFLSREQLCAVCCTHTYTEIKTVFIQTNCVNEGGWWRRQWNSVGVCVHPYKFLLSMDIVLQRFTFFRASQFCSLLFPLSLHFGSLNFKISAIFVDFSST